MCSQGPRHFTVTGPAPAIRWPVPLSSPLKRRWAQHVLLPSHWWRWKIGATQSLLFLPQLWFWINLWVEENNWIGVSWMQKNGRSDTPSIGPMIFEWHTLKLHVTCFLVVLLFGPRVYHLLSFYCMLTWTGAMPCASKKRFSTVGPQSAAPPRRVSMPLQDLKIKSIKYFPEAGLTKGLVMGNVNNKEWWVFHIHFIIIFKINIVDSMVFLISPHMNRHAGHKEAHAWAHQALWLH